MVEGSMSKPIVPSTRLASARILRRSMVPGMRPFGSRPRKMFWAMSRWGTSENSWKITAMPSFCASAAEPIATFWPL
jgi:hypothetical protein